MDTTNIGYVNNWESLTSDQKLKTVELKKKEARIYANEIHIETNQDQQIVSLINQTKKDIWIPTIDGIPAIVLQAKDINGDWKTIRYIYFNLCGNSYSYSKIPKRNKFNVIVELPKKGDLSTYLRFKMFYDDQYIFSNEFSYNIDYCDFFEDNQITDGCMNCKATEYNKLEIKPKNW